MEDIPIRIGDYTRGVTTQKNQGIILVVAKQKRGIKTMNTSYKYKEILKELERIAQEIKAKQENQNND